VGVGGYYWFARLVWEKVAKIIFCKQAGATKKTKIPSSSSASSSLLALPRLLLVLRNEACDDGLDLLLEPALVFCFDAGVMRFATDPSSFLFPCAPLLRGAVFSPAEVASGSGESSSLAFSTLRRPFALFALVFPALLLVDARLFALLLLLEAAAFCFALELAGVAAMGGVSCMSLARA
jgi:hypothetical protein